MKRRAGHLGEEEGYRDRHRLLGRREHPPKVVFNAIKKGGEHNNGQISGAPDKIISMRVESGA